MPSLMNPAFADRTGRALVAVAVAAIAAMALMASVGHRSVRAEAQAETTPPAVWTTDASLPSASSALEHATGGGAESVPTF